jgi:hypothetical protein
MHMVRIYPDSSRSISVTSEFPSDMLGSILHHKVGHYAKSSGHPSKITHKPPIGNMI